MIIITGISGGIGSFLGNRFASTTDEPIVGTYFKNKPNPENATGRIQYLKADLTIETEVLKLVDTLRPAATKIKLVHCAGITVNAMLHKMDYTDWQRVMAANLDSAFLLTKALLPIMRDQNYGRLVLISSIVSQIGVAGTAGYSASKSGLWGFMKAVARENATKNITCNTLNLGYFNVGMIKDVPESILHQIIETIPARKLGNPEDILNAINFIFSSDYITGSSIDINGGLF